MLRYESTSKVSASSARKIRSDLEGISRSWWNGALGFDVDAQDRPGILSGETPLFHRRRDIPDEDDLFMAFVDASFIIQTLGRWAERYKIKWRIRMNDDDWGSVEPSGLSDPLLGQMQKWARRVGAVEIEKGTWVAPGERLDALLRRYSGRH